MFEEYVPKFAKLLIDYCIEAKSGDEVLITSTLEAKLLIKHLIKELVLKDAYPLVNLLDEELIETFYEYAGDSVLKHLSKIDYDYAEVPNASIRVISSTHTKYLASIDSEKIRKRQAALKPLTEIFNKRDEEGSLRWCVTIYPTKALAQQAEMSLKHYEEFIIKACMLDKEDPVKGWLNFSKELYRVCDELSRRTEFRIVHPDGTDLRVVVDKSRKWIVDDGKNNMPGGEIFTAPVEESIEGTIVFSGIQNFRGMFDIENIKLRVKNGVIVDAKAEKGQEFLEKIVNTDEGSRRFGELGIGFNYGITRITRQVLLDEKIGGTIHLAIGMAYRRCGGKNESSIHWDLIKDMRSGGKIYADGELIYENGKFTI
ncbi:MAG: aminopeptidase [Thermoprotei archaeon ex4572_64]|nr:MAG: aminopeptidase [Thermoprotei archaeon ex4572_64]